MGSPLSPALCLMVVALSEEVPELPRSFVLELAAPIWDSGLLEAQSGSLKMRLAALFWGWQPHFEAS